MRRALSVSDLAAALYREGDIHARLDGGVSAEEGSHAHLAIQDARRRQLGERFVAELGVECSVLGLTLRGRLDGLIHEPGNWVIEEYKTTRGDPDALHQHVGSLHWAQVTLYAGLADLPDGPGTLRLVYLRPDGSEARRFERTSSRVDALAFVFDAATRWSTRLDEHERYSRERDRALQQTAFPFSTYRPNQRALAGTVYSALRERSPLLLEAPTGSGKSMATLFPAARALADGYASRLFFLTTRGTGKAAALDAAGRLARAGGPLRTVEITAKQKICFVEGTPCDPEICEFARGYYDRRDEAVAALLSVSLMDRYTIEDTARAHVVCPFELSLDAAVWSDLVVCDYNYVFDPTVRLQRFAAETDSVLLIDEAHALPERVQAMYSARLDRAALKSGIAVAQLEHTLAPVEKRLKSIDRALRAVLKPVRRGDAQRLDDCAALLRSIERLRETLVGDRDSDQPLQLPTQLSDLVFDCLRFERASTWSVPERFVLFGDRRDGATLSLSCLNPGPEIRATLDGFGANVRFSGTLTPLSASQQLHGYDSDSARSSAVATPFAEGSLYVAIVNDIPTRYRQRQDSLPMLADLIAEVVAANNGTTLLAMPSYRYLDQIGLELANRHPTLVQKLQSPDMDDGDRAEFIHELRAATGPVLAGVVLGGVMAESVDFADGALAGAVVVTAALPPPDPVREAMVEHYRDQGMNGYAIAYQRPAMTRAVQAAGRVQRDPADRGTIVLIDDRFARPDYRGYLPEHWQPEVLSQHALPERLRGFWSVPSPQVGD